MARALGWGAHVKSVSRGSGTTPTLMGQDYVAIADNADPKMHVLVYQHARGASAKDDAPCANDVSTEGSGPEATDEASARSVFGKDQFLLSIKRFSNLKTYDLKIIPCAFRDCEWGWVLARYSPR